MGAAKPVEMESNRAVHATREERRAALLAAVEEVGPVLEAEAAGAEDERHLTPAALTALRRSGLLGLKLPLELGGFEADNAVQYEVIERLAYHSTAAAWCMFIYTDILGKVAACLPDEGVARLLAGEGLPLTCGGGGLIPGSLVPVEGGYRLSGRWIYGSGSSGSDYFMVMGANETGAGEPQLVFCLVPSCDMTVEDNWHVVGMRGTGSADYHARDVFVPAALTFPFPGPPLRGGAIFKLGLMGYSAHTIASVAVGGTLRALDEIGKMAETKARGYSSKTPLARRSVFQSFLGQSRLRLMAMRAMMIDVGQRLVAEAESLGDNPLHTEIESRAAASLATLAAVEVMSGIMRYAGGEGARAGHLIERTMRDVQMAQTHFYVSDSSFELHGRSLLGETDLDATS
ncbi:acyl-CoA dehydrogenase family protein [Sphingopyxis sp. 113P3]|uniref:acyl-CoA dehydrogenase family protein n=1 Tax=Sphingopyxis sp. (strain 113P3) TaxID=292913 RepID=UPI0006AD4A3E|nr:acyl-CoA dehydrogenase family protein [Sphingopyxis sp. 113P3]ALC13196.1 hypothetical protein LH20_14665 [Sphingopyxis sp. 113P3]